MKKFLDALKKSEYAYPGTEEGRNEYEKFAVEFAADVLFSLKRQFINEEHHKPMRLSSLGKTPAFELLGKKLELIPMGGKGTVSEGLRLIFTLGDWFEAYIIFTLRRLGYEIVDTQTSVDWNGVSGHIDILIKDEEGIKRLLEVKSSNDWYYKDVTQRGYPDDARGYLTQLLTYSDALKIPREHTHWIFWCKNTSDISVLDLSNVPDDVADERLSRATSIVKAYHACNSIKELYTMVQPPPPSIERTKDGHPVLDDKGHIKMYPNPSVSHPEFCYILEEGKTRWGKKRTYVKDYNYPPEYQYCKPNIVEMAKLYGGL